MTRCTNRIHGRKGPRECGHPAERVYVYRGDRYPRCHRCNSREVREFAEREQVESVEVTA